MKDLKYLAAFSIPAVALMALQLKGYYAYSTVIYAFGVIPVLELLFPQDSRNLSEEEKEKKAKNLLFDWLLYLNIPFVYGISIYTLIDLTNNSYALFEIIGLILSCGIVIGSNGINVAHELGHRQNKTAQTLAKLLLIPALYMHFYIEHNFGHHLNAATKEDPATAKYKQSVYAFWITSVLKQYISAWHIQKNLLERIGHSFLSPKNDMFWFTLIQAAFMGIVFLFFGWYGVLIVFTVAIVGILLLETINYIEHYGLIRKRLASGRYERVQEIHSWNSNHIIGRIVLYELTRHSDHHYKANKKYQLLDYHQTSPEMPYGYPTSMVMALIPPLWFRVMNKRIPKDMKGAT
ncbi:alkane 1-monooxygenase [Leptobacterium sp. I13]|uniref:alkane 1-monooxygenase n=1 Tax=Leptobacterium meishanense TaxID=3128904 RepID=UPI0030ED6A99